MLENYYIPLTDAVDSRLFRGVFAEKLRNADPHADVYDLSQSMTALVRALTNYFIRKYTIEGQDNNVRRAQEILDRQERHSLIWRLRPRSFDVVKDFSAGKDQEARVQKLIELIESDALSEQIRETTEKGILERNLSELLDALVADLRQQVESGTEVSETKVIRSLEVLEHFFDTPSRAFANETAFYLKILGVFSRWYVEEGSTTTGETSSMRRLGRAVSEALNRHEALSGVASKPLTEAPRVAKERPRFETQYGVPRHAYKQNSKNLRSLGVKSPVLDAYFGTTEDSPNRIRLVGSLSEGGLVGLALMHYDGYFEGSDALRVLFSHLFLLQDRENASMGPDAFLANLARMHGKTESRLDVYAWMEETLRELGPEPMTEEATNLVRVRFKEMPVFGGEVPSFAEAQGGFLSATGVSASTGWDVEDRVLSDVVEMDLRETVREIFFQDYNWKALFKEHEAEVQKVLIVRYCQQLHEEYSSYLESHMENYAGVNDPRLIGLVAQELKALIPEIADIELFIREASLYIHLRHRYRWKNRTRADDIAEAKQILTSFLSQWEKPYLVYLTGKEAATLDQAKTDFSGEMLPLGLRDLRAVLGGELRSVIESRFGNVLMSDLTPKDLARACVEYFRNFNYLTGEVVVLNALSKLGFLTNDGRFSESFRSRFPGLLTGAEVASGEPYLPILIRKATESSSSEDLMQRPDFAITARYEIASRPQPGLMIISIPPLNRQKPFEGIETSRFTVFSVTEHNEISCLEIFGPNANPYSLQKADIKIRNLRFVDNFAEGVAEAVFYKPSTARPVAQEAGVYLALGKEIGVVISFDAQEDVFRVALPGNNVRVQHDTFFDAVSHIQRYAEGNSLIADKGPLLSVFEMLLEDVEYADPFSRFRERFQTFRAQRAVRFLLQNLPKGFRDSEIRILDAALGEFNEDGTLSSQSSKERQEIFEALLRRLRRPLEANVQLRPTVEAIGKLVATGRYYRGLSKFQGTGQSDFPPELFAFLPPSYRKVLEGLSNRNLSRDRIQRFLSLRNLRPRVGK